MNHSDDVDHLAECASCRQRFAGNVVTFDAGARRGRRGEFTATAERLERERDDATDVARVLRDTPVEEWPRLAEMAELRNNAALEQLSEEVRRRLPRHNADALAVANIAASIAESLHPTSYPSVVIAQLRSTAWRDRANALRCVARYDEALRSIDRAEYILEPFASLTHDRAVVRLVKGMIFAQTARFDEAHAILAECRLVFREHNDMRRFQQAALAEANALYEATKYDHAHNIYEDLLQDPTIDLEIQARVHNNLGYCATHLGNYVQANIHFSEAVAKFTDLGFTAEVPRTARGAGLVMIARGQITRGLALLHDARSAFTAAGMVEESGLCALNIASVLIDRGDVAEARSLVQNVADEFADVGLDEQAITAVVRLRDAIDMDDATAETVRTVHALIEGIREGIHESAS